MTICYLSVTTTALAIGMYSYGMATWTGLVGKLIHPLAQGSQSLLLSRQLRDLLLSSAWKGPSLVSLNSLFNPAVAWLSDHTPG